MVARPMPLRRPVWEDWPPLLAATTSPYEWPGQVMLAPGGGRGASGFSASGHARLLIAECEGAPRLAALFVAFGGQS
jgi:hypothetical protein